MVDAGTIPPDEGAPGDGAAAAAPDDLRCESCGGRIELDWKVCGWCGRGVGADGTGAPPATVLRPEGDAAARLPAGQEGPAPRVGDAPGDPTDQSVGGVESLELPSGTLLLGRYRIDALLGRGGFGVTYRVRDTRLHRDVALKELFPPAAFRRGEDVAVVESDRASFEAARNRFQREAAALARFNHPGIVRIFEVFEANNTAYLVMELIDGASLGEVLRDRGEPFGVDEVLDLVLRVGDALSAVHEAGLLHRDVNPSNLMVDGDRRVVLIDFGLARRYGDDISGSVTRAVTPGYAPPEQYAGSARSGPPCDVFGLAATAYKLLTGTTPTNVFDRQAGAALPDPRTLRPDAPPMVAAALLDGMELEPGHRPATIDAFLNRLGLFGVRAGPRVLLASSTGVDPTVAGSEAGPVAVPDVVVPPGTPGFDATAGPAWPGAAWPGARPGVAAGGDSTAAAAPSVPPVPGATRAAAPVGAVARPGVGMPGPVLHGGAAPPVPGIERSEVAPLARWRGWVTWPVAVALVALTSASPLIVSVIVALGVLPGLATLGDVEVHRRRRAFGTQRTRWHQTRTSVVWPVRFLRNLLVGALRAIPAAVIGAIGVVTVDLIGDGSSLGLLRDASIRVFGAAMALVLLVPARLGGRGFRTDLGTTTWATRIMEGRRRPGARAFVVWVLALAAVAFGAWLDPELWPLT